jgi:hypothetical protein
LLPSSLVTIFGFGSGLDIIKYQPIAKPYRCMPFFRNPKIFINLIMRNNVRSGLVVGIATTIFFVFKSVIAWVTGEQETTDEILKSVFASLLAGLVSGLLFGWFTDKYLVFGLFAKGANFDLDDNETIISKKQANRLTSSVGIGGYLCLTDKKLIFKSYSSDTNNQEWTINLSDISGVEKFRTLGLVNNGIKIITKEKVVERFVVDRQKQWLQSINQIKTAYNN